MPPAGSVVVTKDDESHGTGDDICRTTDGDSVLDKSDDLGGDGDADATSPVISTPRGDTKMSTASGDAGGLAVVGTTGTNAVANMSKESTADVGALPNASETTYCLPVIDLAATPSR